MNYILKDLLPYTHLIIKRSFFFIVFSLVSLLMTLGLQTITACIVYRLSKLTNTNIIPGSNAIPENTQSASYLPDPNNDKPTVVLGRVIPTKDSALPETTDKESYNRVEAQPYPQCI